VRKKFCNNKDNEELGKMWVFQHKVLKNRVDKYWVGMA